MRQILPMSDPEVRTGVLGVVRDTGRIAEELAQEFVRASPPSASTAASVRYLPLFMSRTVLKNLRAGEALLGQGMATSCYPHSRTTLELVIQFDYIYDAETTTRATQFAAVQMLSPQLQALRMAPGTPDHERHGAAWDEITGGLLSSPIPWIRERVLATVHAIEDVILRDASLRYWEVSDPKRALLPWHEAFGHGPLSALASKVEGNPRLLPLYETMYRFLSRMSHGGDLIVGAMDEAGIRAPHEASDGEIARAVDVFLHLHITFQQRFNDRVLGGGEETRSVLEQLHERRASCLVQ